MKRSMQRKWQLVAELKKNPCSDCGQTYPSYVMDFDHRPGVEKSHPISKRNTISWLAVHAKWDRVLEEVAKCDLVCSNCHRARTHARLVAVPPPVKQSWQYRAGIRRRELLWSLKNVPCADCEQKYLPSIMDFDHRPGVIKVGPVSTLQVSKKRLLEEVSKCDVVCSNCHRERTHQQRMARRASAPARAPRQQPLPRGRSSRPPSG